MKKEVVKIDFENANNRIDKFLSEFFVLSRSHIQKLIDDGNVTSNGVIVSKSYKIQEDDEISILFPDPVDYSILPQNIPLDIVFEDNDLLIVNKPKGMIVHPAPGVYKDTLVNALLYHCADSLSGINGINRPGIIHRLDKDTSGLIVVAKNDFAHIRISSQLKEHKPERIYHSVTVGSLKLLSQTINKPMGRNPSDRLKMAVVEKGKEAVTSYNVLKAYRGYDYISLSLQTGRTHQIRVHMSSIGHPVFCDSVYGANNTDAERHFSKLFSGQCLHAKSIGFIHPRNEKYMFFETDLPDYFKSVLDYLESKYL